MIVGHPEPEDGRIVDCIMGGDYPWPPSAVVQFPSFGIPLDSSAISVLARGKQATGSVTVKLDQTSEKDEITVDVAARYHDWDMLSGTTVCLMEKEKGELGVGVFVSSRLLITVARSPPTKDSKTPDLDEQDDRVRDHSEDPPSTIQPDSQAPQV